MGGSQRVTASTKVLSALGRQSFCTMCVPEHMKALLSAASWSLCFTPEMIRST